METVTKPLALALAGNYGLHTLNTKSNKKVSTFNHANMTWFRIHSVMNYRIN